MNIFRSIAKSIKLQRISELLAGDLRQVKTLADADASIDRMMHDIVSGGAQLKILAQKENKGFSKLLELIMDEPDLRHIVEKHGATPDDLRRVYDELKRRGTWTNGHWTPASSLAFVATLDFILKQHNLNMTEDVRVRLRTYFEKNESGSIE